MSKAHKIQQAWTEGKPKYVFGFGDQHGHYGFSATLQRGDVYVELEALEALQQQVEQLQQENERLQQQVERYRDRAQATRKLYEMTYNDVESLLRDWVPAACNLITDIAEQPENSDG